MPHQNTPPAQVATSTADRSEDDGRVGRPEPRSYVATDVADATLAAPAAGEMSDYADDGEALGVDGVQQGRNHTRRPIRTEAKRGQGPKTLAANRRMVKSGSPDQGTH